MGVVSKAVRLGALGTIAATLILLLGSLAFSDSPPDSEYNQPKKVLA
ncbi:MAG: hypothetical protein JKY25_06945 [Robiginitomaculum sp.]|nr:hypothetical protein [Robiginitomaculum sp.]